MFDLAKNMHRDNKIRWNQPHFGWILKNMGLNEIADPQETKFTVILWTSFLDWKESIV